MVRPTLCTVAVLLALATFALADPELLSIEDVREEALARIHAANVSLPSSATGAKSLQSYRIIDPYMIADLITSIAFMYSAVVHNYPDITQYDSMDLKLFGVQYIPQRVEFNYVNRV